jgi:hypothetical protein
MMLRAIAAGKRKNDLIDARKIADLLRCDYFPECHMATPEVRNRRRVLRYRNLLVRQAVRMKNKVSGLLMETGISYNKTKLHTKRYFAQLLEERRAEMPESLPELLQLSRTSIEMLTRMDRQILRALMSPVPLRPEDSLCGRLRPPSRLQMNSRCSALTAVLAGLTEADIRAKGACDGVAIAHN